MMKSDSLVEDLPTGHILHGLSSDSLLMSSLALSRGPKVS